MPHLQTEVRNGICVVTFDRPPVNAISVEVYEELGRLVEHIEGSTDVRVVVLTAPPVARAWCGGADLNDFVGMTADRRRERYEFINSVLPRFATLDRPTIAAITGPVVGVGVILAGLCDLRVASTTATFASPEVNYGLVGGGAGLLDHLNLPAALIREMVFTGERYSADAMLAGGFLNQVAPREEVLEIALDLAGRIAAKSLPVLQADKRTLVGIEGLGWLDGYLLAQEETAGLVEKRDSQEGVRAFLDDRKANVTDS